MNEWKEANPSLQSQVSLEASISLLGSSLKTLSQSYFVTHQT